MAVAPLAGDGELEVFEADRPVAADGAGDLVHVVVDALVHALDPAAHVDLALQQLRIIDAGEVFELFDQRERFSLGDELGALDAVHQQLQLRQLKVARGDVIAGALVLALHDVHAEAAQRLDVVVDRLALGGNVLPRQLLDHVLHRDRVRLVAVFHQIAQQIEQLQLLIG